MELGHILVVAAIGDEAVARFVEIEFLHEALHGCHQVYQKISIAWFEGHQAADLAFRHEEDVQGIARLGVIESNQQICLA